MKRVGLAVAVVIAVWVVAAQVVLAGALSLYQVGNKSVAMFQNETGEEAIGLILEFTSPVTPINTIGVGAHMTLTSNDGNTLMFEGTVVPDGVWEVDWNSTEGKLVSARWLTKGNKEEIDVHTPTVNIFIKGGMVDERITFSALGSRDPDGKGLVHYAWEWEDGTTAEGYEVSRVYHHWGIHKVTLTVTDKDGDIASKTDVFVIHEQYSILPSLYIKMILVGHLPKPLEEMAGVILNGKVYLLGGGSYKEDGTWVYNNDIIEVDPTTWSSRIVGQLPFSTGSWVPTAAVANGKIFMYASTATPGEHSGLYEIDPSTWSVSYRSDFPTDKVGWLCDMTSMNNKLYIAGGMYLAGGNYPQHGEVWEYDPITGTANVIGTLPKPAYFVSLTTLGKKIYALGGYQAWSDSLDDIVEIDPSAGTVRKIGQLPHPSDNTSAVLSIPPHYIYLIGGSSAQAGFESQWYNTAIEVVTEPNGDVTAHEIPLLACMGQDNHLCYTPGPKRWAYAGFTAGQAFMIGGDGNLGPEHTSNKIWKLLPVK